MKTLSNKRW